MNTLQQEAVRILEKIRLLEQQARLLEQQAQERARAARARADLAIKRTVERDLAQIQQRDLGTWEV